MRLFPALAAACLSGCVAQLDPPPLAEPLRTPSGAILVFHHNTELCTAVAIDSHHALTARHCVHGDATLELPHQSWPVIGSVKDPDADVATLEVAEPLPDWVDSATRPVRAGDLLQIWGYGCGIENSRMPPEVRVAVALSDHSASAETCQGDSGGAVIGADGLVGIVHGVSPTYTEFTPL